MSIMDRLRGEATNTGTVGFVTPVEQDRHFLVDLTHALAEGEVVDDVVWVQALKPGPWYDPRYGDEVIDRALCEEMISHFRSGARGVDLAIDYEHGLDPAKGKQAAGWVKDMRLSPDGTLEWAVQFTEDAKAEIKAGKWRYFSPEYWKEWVHNHTKELLRNVPVGAALTNRPVQKNLAPINLSEMVLPTAEVADKEHSEPGSGGGGEPIPREQETPIATPPPNRVDEPDPTVTGSPPDPGASKEETVDLEQLRKRLGLPDEADEAAVLAAVDEMKKNADVVRAAAEGTDKAVKFAEAFPEEHRRLLELSAAKVETDARTFAESYREFTVGEGEAAKKRALSEPAIAAIADAHRALADGSASTETLKSLVDSLAGAPSVELGERGSQTVIEDEPADLVRKFSERVATLRTEEKLETGAALLRAAQEMPEGFNAYRLGVGRKAVN